MASVAAFMSITLGFVCVCAPIFQGLEGAQNPNSPVHAMASMAWGIHGMVHPKSKACQGKMPALVLLKFFPQSEGMCVGLGVAQHCLHLEKWPIQNCECNDAGQAKPKRVTTQKAVPGCL